MKMIHRKDFYLMPFNLPKEKHQLRNQLHLETGKAFKTSWEEFDTSLLEKLNIQVSLPKAVPMASDPRWANRLFGAVNTVEKSGCVAFVSKIIFDFFGYDISMEDLLSLTEDKGYRMWKLRDSKKTLNIPKAEAEAIKACYPKEDPIQNCKTLEEIYTLYGEPMGIGGSMFLIDNIIYSLSKDIINLYLDTRINSVYTLINILGKGFPVPVRVNNSIYHDDITKKEGHYITIVSLSNGEAVVADTSNPTGYRCLPAKQLFEAMVADEGLICAWNISHCSHK